MKFPKGGCFSLFLYKMREGIFFKIIFILKWVKIILFYLKKIIFNINISCKYKKIILNK